MRRRGTPVSREALYEEVWTDAVTVVAPRYGLSDVGLVKICKKLGIPVPPRGYWAKVKAGRPTRKVPLPALPAGARDLSGPIPLSEQEAAMHARVRDALQHTRESQPNLSLPDELEGTGVYEAPQVVTDGNSIRVRLWVGDAAAKEYSLRQYHLSATGYRLTVQKRWKR